MSLLQFNSHEDQWAGYIIKKAGIPWELTGGSHKVEHPLSILPFGTAVLVNAATISLNVDPAGRILPGGVALTILYKAKERFFSDIEDILCKLMIFVFEPEGDISEAFLLHETVSDVGLPESKPLF